MEGQAKNRYTFGKAQNWLDDEPNAPSAVEPEVDREAYKRTVQEAAASVGYVAPSEQPKPEKVVPIVAKPKKVAAQKQPKPDPDKGKGRPKGDRTIQMSVRIRQEHDDLIKAIAQDDFSVASIVEAAMIAFAKTLVQDKKYKRMPLDGDTLSLAKAIAEGGR
jgi:hypothetical protein